MARGRSLSQLKPGISDRAAAYLGSSSGRIYTSGGGDLDVPCFIFFYYQGLGGCVPSVSRSLPRFRPPLLRWENSQAIGSCQLSAQTRRKTAYFEGPSFRLGLVSV